MRSLWSGISGMQAHQVAMDVEGNNISNVNTVGFKYSRTSFQDLLSQTARGATSPQGKLGGKNPLQVGSGTTVATVERIFSQGANQNTDKQTDLSIQGDGFFVVSGDGGRTYNYTRAGNFNFDANGNYVMPSGMIVQGWLADENYEIDATAPIENITIDPGMTTPAKATSKVEIDANLNSGTEVKNKSPISTTTNVTDDFNDLYTLEGETINLKSGIDKITFNLQRTYDLAGVTTTQNVTLALTYGEGTSDTDGYFTTVKDMLDEINAAIRDSTGINNNRVLLTGDGRIAGAGKILSVDTTTPGASTNTTLNGLFDSIGSGTMLSDPLKSVQNGFLGADDVGELFNEDGDAYSLKEGQGVTFNIDGLGETRNFIYREPNSNNDLDYLDNNFQSGADITTVDNQQGFRWMLDASGNQAFMTTGQQIQFTFDNTNTGLTTQTYTYGTDFTTIEDLLNAVKVDLAGANKESYALTFDDTNGLIKDTQGALTGVTVLDSTGTAATAGSPLDNLNTVFSSLGGANTATAAMKKNDTYYFTDIQELVNLYQLSVDDFGDANTSGIPNSGIVSLDENGRIMIENTGSNPFTIETAGYPDNILANQRFLETMSALTGAVASGTSSISNRMFAATHATSIEVFSSAGSKHNITLHFRKESTSTDSSTPSVWNWYAEAPDPSTFNYPSSGTLKFNEDGSLQSFNPPTLTFNPNTGAASGQIIQLDFGSINGFDGITSFAGESNTANRNRDGYAGGSLREITVDQTGTVIGTFSNDQNFKLGQVAMATFANNAGLDSKGGNVFAKSPNSGEENVGTAGSGSRGSITPSTLEMSNVDLSDSLTNLIVVQRGYQANSKTITTSDQMLQTLLGLKQ